MARWVQHRVTTNIRYIREYAELAGELAETGNSHKTCDVLAFLKQLEDKVNELKQDWCEKVPSDERKRELESGDNNDGDHADSGELQLPNIHPLPGYVNHQCTT